MFIDQDLSLDEKIEYFIKLYEIETNEKTKIIILEELDKLYKESKGYA
ncbi:MAG: hypothetical protein ACI4OT_02170 [Bacilli bacterium]